LEDLVACLAGATGVPYTLDDVVRAGERIWNLERWWNLRAGLTAADDTLPRRLLKEPLPSGPSAGVTVKLDKMLPEYYALRGWTPTGEPTAGKLIELGIL
jgi:aldehyde:ferredoxin oxidoreductase